MMQQETVSKMGGLKMTAGGDTMIDPRGVGEKGRGGARVVAFSIAAVGVAADWRWLDEEVCRLWLLKQFYPAGPSCPVCGVEVRNGKATDSWWHLRRVHCHNCGSFYRATRNTILHRCNLKFRQVVMLAWAFVLGLDNSRAAKLSGINPKTARLWRLRLEVVVTNTRSEKELINEKL